MNTMTKLFGLALLMIAAGAATLDAAEGHSKFYERIQLRTEDATDKLPEYEAPVSNENTHYKFSERVALRTEEASDKLPQEPVSANLIPAPSGIEEGCFMSENAEKRQACIDKWQNRVEERLEESGS